MKKIDMKKIRETVRKRSGEITVALVIVGLLITVISVSAPVLSNLFNKDEQPTEPTVSFLEETDPTTEPTTEPEETDPPETEPPETEPEETDPPETEPAHQHNHNKNKTISPTCTQKGYSVYLCSCGDTYKADYKDALGHDWSAWVITKQPTETAEGAETRTCGRCGITEDRSIDKLPAATEPEETDPPAPSEISYRYVWVKKDWSGLSGARFNLDASSIWTDGNNTYYSFDTDQYVLNKETNAWERKSWNGYWEIYGNDIWTDGVNTYFSYNPQTNLNRQYVLNKETNTWEPKVWNGLTGFDGYFVWTDGANMYYSFGRSQYVLNGDTWEPKVWNGLTSFNGSRVWTDGNNTYYSEGNLQYVLNGDTWEPKVWNGLTSFNSSQPGVWKYENKIYYSDNQRQYVLNGDTWEPVIWVGLNDFDGNEIWTDGTHIYHSWEKEQQILVKEQT